jgi:hypothetical protein
MKKSLLLLGGIFTLNGLVHAQTTLTFANEPAINDATVRYIVDSMAPNMATTTGTNQVWDYSAIHGYPNNDKILTVIAATSGPNTSDFPSATNMLNIPGYTDTYYEYNGSTERISDGFVMNLDMGGTPISVVVKYDADPAKSMQFPFTYSDNFTDLMSGNISGSATGTFTGSTNVVGDGTGTLKLQNKDFTNVLRVHTTDTIYANITGLGNATIVRNQIDYFINDSIFPLFTHTQTSFASTLLTQTIGVVLSAVNPTADAGINTLDNAIGMNVYPNPSNGEVNVYVKDISNTKIEVLNTVGQIVKTIYPTNNQTVIDLNNQTIGMYFVKVSNGNTQKTTKLIVK